MKQINDNIHKLIPLDNDILKIIDTPIFQRLGKIKQLTSAEYVFPGARHSRKEHCIGAMFLAKKYSEALKLSEKETKLIMVASLLHDIGHGLIGGSDTIRVIDVSKFTKSHINNTKIVGILDVMISNITGSKIFNQS